MANLYVFKVQVLYLQVYCPSCMNRAEKMLYTPTFSLTSSEILQRSLDLLFVVALNLVANLELRPAVFECNTAFSILVHAQHILLLVLERADNTYSVISTSIQCEETNKRKGMTYHREEPGPSSTPSPWSPSSPLHCGPSIPQ